MSMATEWNLTPKEMITSLYSEGVTKTYVDAYYMCLDMGEFGDNLDLLIWSRHMDSPNTPIIGA